LVCAVCCAAAAAAAAASGLECSSCATSPSVVETEGESGGPGTQASIRQHPSASVSIRQHTSAYASTGFWREEG
jgi:hypothetical protein